MRQTPLPHSKKGLCAERPALPSPHFVLRRDVSATRPRRGLRLTVASYNSPLLGGVAEGRGGYSLLGRGGQGPGWVMLSLTRVSAELRPRLRWCLSDQTGVELPAVSPAPGDPLLLVLLLDSPPFFPIICWKYRFAPRRKPFPISTFNVSRQVAYALT